MKKDEEINSNSIEFINNMNTLWVEKYRPSNIDDLAVSDDLKSFLDYAITKNDLTNVIFYGKPGTGKNSCINVLKNHMSAKLLIINASEERGIDTIRDKVQSFALTAAWGSLLKIVVMNEADGLNYIAQDSLRELMETASKTCRFIFTCNNINKISEPIRSRCSEFELSPNPKPIAKRLVEIFTNENVDFEDLYVPLLIKKYHTDMRKMINESQRIYSIYNSLPAKALNNDNKKYTEFFDSLFSIKSPKKMSELTKPMIFDEDVYSVLKDYILEKYDNPTAVLAIGDYAWKSKTMTDKDLAFLCCIFTLQDMLDI
jgi:DNA polymerase III delta prime subunit